MVTAAKKNDTAGVDHIAPNAYGNRKRSCVATPIRDCKNLVNGIAYSRYSLGASIPLETCPSCVRSRHDTASARNRTCAFGLRETVSTCGQDLALETRIQHKNGQLRGACTRALALQPKFCSFYPCEYGHNGAPSRW